MKFKEKRHLATRVRSLLVPIFGITGHLGRGELNLLARTEKLIQEREQGRRGPEFGCIDPGNNDQLLALTVTHVTTPRSENARREDLEVH